MSHVVLLGDSIFDNAPYVNGGPAVIDHLRQQLPPAWQATLLAVDGSQIYDISRQLAHIPSDASHLVLSIGGNDALSESGALEAKTPTVAQALLRLAEIEARFEASYQAMLQPLLQRQQPTAICTIYYASYPDAMIQRITSTALAIFNDCIIRAAIQYRLPLIDLRLVCNEPADYANPIEPSVQGGAKIAAAITRVVTQHDFTNQQMVGYV